MAHRFKWLFFGIVLKVVKLREIIAYYASREEYKRNRLFSRAIARLIVHYATSAMKRFLTSDVITLVKKTFFRTSIVRHFISRGVK